MRRRALLASPLVAVPLPTANPAPASAQQGSNRLITEEFMVPARDPGIELYLRNKRPEGAPSGRPDRTVLYVHGGTSPSHTTFDLPLGGVSWMDFIAGRGFDVWCMDMRGFGRSTRPPEMAQPASANPPLVRGETAVQDIAAVAGFIRQRRGLPRITLIGWSQGTTRLGRYASENPQLVERVVLYGALWVRPQAPASQAQAAPAPLGAYGTLTQAQARERWLAGVPEDKKAGLIPPGWFEQYAEATWASDPEGMRQSPPVLRFPNGGQLDNREYWNAGRPYYDPAKITAPTLVVTGEWDTLTPPSLALALFSRLTNSPGKRLVILAEGSHFMLMERNRGALFQAVQAFLEEATA